MQKPNESSSSAKPTEEKKTASTNMSNGASDPKDKSDSGKENAGFNGESKSSDNAKSADSSKSAGAKSASRTATSASTGSSTSGMTYEHGADGPLHKFFLDALKDIYYAEHAMLDALPKMQKAATTEELQDAFEDHELMTRKQVSRLEKVFRSLEEEPAKKKCEAIEGLVKEAESIIKATPEGSMTRDAALIIAAQKVEHYEIASYGGLVQLAITLGYEKAADLLDQTLEEEEDTDYELTLIAESFINFEAEEEASDDFEDEDYGDEEEEEDEEDYDDEE